MSLSRFGIAMCMSLAFVTPGYAQSADDVDPRPLSPAQTQLFQTPHLGNINRPETLDYRFVQTGPGGFTDRVEMHVNDVHPDGTKDITFDFLTGEHHEQFAGVAGFAGNPVLMLFLQNDVEEMREHIGLAAIYFRNRIREAFVDGAEVTDTSFVLDGKTVPARKITIHPFAKEQRLEKLPSIQHKTYSFLLADAVPGMVAELSTDVPADATIGSPEFSKQLTFTGEKP